MFLEIVATSSEYDWNEQEQALRTILCGAAHSGQSLVRPEPEAPNLADSVTQVKVNIVTNQHHRTRK